MNDALTRVLQAANRGHRPLQMFRVGIVSGSPLTVRMPDGTIIPAVGVQGLTYAGGGAAVALFAEPGIPFVWPVTGGSPTATPTAPQTSGSGSTSTPPPPTGTTGGSTGSTGGTQPAGTGIVAFQTLTGSKFSATVNSAGTGNLVSFPAGTFEFVDFSDGTQTISQGASVYGAAITAKGILGAGQASTILQMRAGSSTKAGDVPPDSAATGGATSPTNNLYLVKLSTAGAKVDGVTLRGTSQGHLYNGLRFETVDSPTLSNTTITAIPGDSSTPPGETFFVNFAHASGTVTVTNVTVDGAGVGAAGMASNSSTGNFNVNGLVTKNLAYSAGWASWQQSGPMTFTNWHATNSARHFNAERLSGAVTFNDPVWNQPFTGKHDINYTWDTGWVGGSITFRFSSWAAWQAFIANRSTKQIFIVTNPNGHGDIRSTVKVYIAGALQPTSTYVLWDGRAT